MNSNSNSTPVLEVGHPRESLNGSINSVSRTKTVSFSQNGPFEEVIKFSIPKKSLGDEVVTSSFNDVVIGKDVMNLREHYIDHSMLNKDDYLSPPCNERVSCDSIEPPPGFELAVTAKP